jgi:prophage regulatory protein
MGKVSTPPAVVDAGDDRILTTRELVDRVGLARNTIWRLVRDGRFPKPIQLTPARIGWDWTDVRAWLDERKRAPITAHMIGGRGPRKRRAR